MHEIAVFVEDFAHESFLSILIYRLAGDFGISLNLEWLSARRGHGAVVRELRQFLRDLQLRRAGFPDLVVVATDANCQGYTKRRNEISAIADKVPLRTICAIPDPHIERWLLLDSMAFKTVFGRGCDAPDQKCERARYKRMLIDSIRKSGVIPSLGGIEFAEDIVKAMDLDRACGADISLARFVNDLQSIFTEWRRRSLPAVSPG
jgi:hypothetical protein